MGTKLHSDPVISYCTTMNFVLCVLRYFDILESHSIKAAECCIKFSHNMITNSSSLFGMRDHKGTENKLHLPQTFCSTFTSAATPSVPGRKRKSSTGDFESLFLALLFSWGEKMTYIVWQKFRQASTVRSLETNVNHLAIL